MPALSAAQLELLRGVNFGVVSTVDSHGRPQTSVVWVDTDGEHVVFNTTNGRAKGRNLRSNPHVSITVWDNEDPYRYFEVEGVAELDENGATEHIHSLAQRYHGRQCHSPRDRVFAPDSTHRTSHYEIDV